MILSVFPAVVSYSNFTPAATKSGLAFLTFCNTWFFTSGFTAPFWTSAPVISRTAGSFGTADRSFTVSVLDGVAVFVQLSALSFAFNVTVNPPLGIVVPFNFTFNRAFTVLPPVTPPLAVNVVAPELWAPVILYFAFPLAAEENAFIPSPNSSSWIWTSRETSPLLFGVTNNVTWLLAGVVAKAFPVSPTFIVGAIPSPPTVTRADLSDLTSVCLLFL